MQFFTEDSLNFQERISQRNGLGNATSLPPSLHEEPPLCNMVTAREEAELVLFGSVQEVLDKAGTAVDLLDVHLHMLYVIWPEHDSALQVNIACGDARASAWECIDTEICDSTSLCFLCHIICNPILQCPYCAQWFGIQACKQAVFAQHAEVNHSVTTMLLW